MKKTAIYLFYSIIILATLFSIFILISGKEIVDVKTLAFIIICIGISSISISFFKNKKDDTFF